MPSEPHISTDLKYLPTGGMEFTYCLAHRLASPLLLVTVAAMVLMSLAILYSLVGLADFLAVETYVRILNAILIFAFLCYWARQFVWAFPRCETIVRTGDSLAITRRMCGIRVRRRFGLRPGALGVQFETSWSSLTKPRYRLHYESGGRQCDFARGLPEQTARELLIQLTHRDARNETSRLGSPYPGPPLGCEP